MEYFSATALNMYLISIHYAAFIINIILKRIYYSLNNSHIFIAFSMLEFTNSCAFFIVTHSICVLTVICKQLSELWLIPHLKIQRWLVVRSVSLWGRNFTSFLVA
jgi:hypothetical protein